MIRIVVVIVVIVVIVGAALVQWMDQPAVYKSWSTQKCVKVDDPAQTVKGKPARGTCANLPASYELVWVK